MEWDLLWAAIVAPLGVRLLALLPWSSEASLKIRGYMADKYQTEYLLVKDSICCCLRRLSRSDFFSCRVFLFLRPPLYVCPLVWLLAARRFRRRLSLAGILPWTGCRCRDEVSNGCTENRNITECHPVESTQHLEVCCHFQTFHQAEERFKPLIRYEYFWIFIFINIRVCILTSILIHVYRHQY